MQKQKQQQQSIKQEGEGMIGGWTNDRSMSWWDSMLHARFEIQIKWTSLWVIKLKCGSSCSELYKLQSVVALVL